MGMPVRHLVAFVVAYEAGQRAVAHRDVRGRWVRASRATLDPQLLPTEAGGGGGGGLRARA